MSRELPPKAVQEDKFLNVLADAFRLQEAIINSTQLAIITTSPEGLITSFNHAAENLLGYTSTELVEKETILLLYDIDEIVKKADAVYHSTGKEILPLFNIFSYLAETHEAIYREEWTLIKKDTTKIPALISYTKLHDDEGVLLGYLAIAEDISEAKLTHEKLERIADENLHIFNISVNLNAVVGFDGYFKRISPSWETLLGWTEKELLNTPFMDLIHPEDAEFTINAASAVAKGKKVPPVENRYRCKDGSYKWLLWGSAPDMKREVIYATAINISERKRSEEKLIHSKLNLETIAGKLQEQNRQLDEFAHIISHNLRSPVKNIQALINLLDDQSSIAEYRTIFEKLKNVSKNLSETMNDLMDTIKAKEDASVEKSQLKFKEVLDKVVQSLEGDLIQAEASVTFDFNEAPSIFYPKPYLESIFQNLLSNALKYRSFMRKPLVHFETRMNQGNIELRVSDNGQGIDLERYGDKLFGLHKTFHAHEEARGVGLFLVRTQIEAMGGSITAESAVEQGTTFIIKF